MFSRNRTNESTESCWASVRKAAALIQDADAVLVGVGSGATAAGGLCYADPELAKRWYPEYYALGRRSITEIMGDFWVTTVNERNAAAYWGFWAKHIVHIRYEAPILQPYRDLFRLMQGRRCFVVSTNVDGQLEKAGFEKTSVFAPQGDYALFQCASPCSDEVYDNKDMVDAMLKNMVSPLEIHPAHVPRCPRCGGLLIPNLRCGDTFVEAPHIKNIERYEAFLKEAYGRNLVLLELGVGFNTPGIIRFPFEAMARQYPNTTLIRVNRDDAAMQRGKTARFVGIKEDVKTALRELVRMTSAEI